MSQITAHSWLKWVKRGLITLVVVLVAIFIRRYDYSEVPENLSDLGSEAPPGSKLILARIRESSELGPGTLVQVEFQKRLLLSKIVGVGGEEIVAKPEPGGFELRVGGRLVGSLHQLGAIRTGPIPAGRFLLLDPNPSAGGADSRHVGFVTRAQIRRKVLAVFKP